MCHDTAALLSQYHIYGSTKEERLGMYVAGYQKVGRSKSTVMAKISRMFPGAMPPDGQMLRFEGNAKSTQISVGLTPLQKEGPASRLASRSIHTLEGCSDNTDVSN